MIYLIFTLLFLYLPKANQVWTVDEITDVRDFGSCNELFLRASSPLSRCFMRIDPRPFFWHCVRDMNRPSFYDENQNTACDATDAYRTRCASQGMFMPPLLSCPRGEGEIGIVSLVRTISETIISFLHYNIFVLCMKTKKINK